MVSLRFGTRSRTASSRASAAGSRSSRCARTATPMMAKAPPGTSIPYFELNYGPSAKSTLPRSTGALITRSRMTVWQSLAVQKFKL